MIDFECELWQQTPVNEILLRLYVEHDRQSRAQNPQFDGWFGRIQRHPEIPPDDLTKGHGNLIALGFLKVDIGGRFEGVRYQLTTAGKRQLDAPLGVADEGEASDAQTAVDDADVDAEAA